MYQDRGGFEMMERRTASDFGRRGNSRVHIRRAFSQTVKLDMDSMWEVFFLEMFIY